MNNGAVKVKIFESYGLVSAHAAELVQVLISQKANAVLGLATGSTPEGLYSLLVHAYNSKKIDFSKLATFNLDEYCPIKRTNDQSYWFFMQQHLFSQVNLPKEHIHVLNGEATDALAECTGYEAAIRAAGGIDLQVLGIGNNGHIAFNEPGASPTSRTRVVNLDESTVEANSRYFTSAEAVPRQALSMGLGTIMEARQVILLASGIKKAEAIRRTLEGPVTDAVPASILQQHPNCTFILDRDAASLLKNSSHE